MQIYFSAEQFAALADILLNQGDPAGLLPRVMNHNLHFDFNELEQVRETLVANWSNTTKALDACQEPQARLALTDQQARLENMIERVTESFAML